jgi:hypothetical protein
MSFPLYNDMADLVEGTYATGKGVVRPGHTRTPSISSSSSSDNDFLIDPILHQTSATPVSAMANALAVSSSSVALATLSGVCVPTSSKCQAADTFESMSGKRVCHGCKSGSQAIEDVASSIDWLATALAVDAAAPSLERKRAAIHTIEDDGDLSDNEQTQVFQVICKDTAFADTVLAISKKEACTRFIKSKLYPLLAGTSDF